MDAALGRSTLLLFVAALACSRARAEHSPEPAAPSAQAKTPEPAASGSAAEPVAQPLPAPPKPELPPAEHDRALLPCPKGRPLCEPLHPLIAAGVLERAERYLKECKLCKHSALVKQTVLRAREVSERDRRDRRRHEPKDCTSSDDVAILVSPHSPTPSDRPRVIVASDAPFTTIEIASEQGEVVEASPQKSGGPYPHFRVLALKELPAGAYRVRVSGAIAACERFEVRALRRQRFKKSGVWASGRGWDENAENLYSAWIASAFDAAEGKRWKGIAEITTDPKRNFLHDHLGLGEDRSADKLGMRPDCADAPYVMRAYFAFKLGLPFGRHICRYGEIDGPPRCRDWVTNLTWGEQGGAEARRGFEIGSSRAQASPEPDASSAPPPAERNQKPKDPPRLRASLFSDQELTPLSAWDFRQFAEQLIDDVNARSLRTALADDATDLYPVALEREHLRPGVVFSDAYGHTLTIVKWIPQVGSAPGKLLAVDAQPDGTLGMRRFWRGNFVFADEHPIGGFGFKAFRPIILDRIEDRQELRLLENSEIAVAKGYGGFSLAQKTLDAADFYATLTRLISPVAPPPERELDDLVAALGAQLDRRVAEVAMADEIVSSRKTPIPMPKGREIFRTTGPWEAVSTPCRDLRLLVGIDALIAYPEQAARMAGDPALAQKLERRLGEKTAARSVEYQRSDGSNWRLTLAEIIARRTRFEMAYNPNDCSELRWGASEGSTEASTCTRRASKAERREMDQMRHWFVKRYSCG